jgi:hypothetical protein
MTESDEKRIARLLKYYSNPTRGLRADEKGELLFLFIRRELKNKK